MLRLDDLLDVDLDGFGVSPIFFEDGLSVVSLISESSTTSPYPLPDIAVSVVVPFFLEFLVDAEGGVDPVGTGADNFWRFARRLVVDGGLISDSSCAGLDSLLFDTLRFFEVEED